MKFGEAPVEDVAQAIAAALRRYVAIAHPNLVPGFDIGEWEDASTSR